MKQMIIILTLCLLLPSFAFAHCHGKGAHHGDKQTISQAKEKKPINKTSTKKEKENDNRKKSI